MNPKVNEFLKRSTKWREEMTKLRTIMLDSQLDEELKWGKPCYAFQQSNVVIIQGFKDYCALLFIKGALLKDPAGVLVQQTENVQSARQIRFTGLDEIIELEPVIKACVAEAIEVEKAGLKVEFKKELTAIPEELQTKFNEMPDLEKAFYALTPGRQRAYVLHFSAAKQSATRASRVAKCIPLIMAGKGLND